MDGDKNDEVFISSIVQGADFCSNFRLGPQGTCQYSLFFNTRDVNKAASDTNSGLWRIFTSVTYFPTPQAPTTETAYSHVLVEVLDPGAESTIAEPSSLLLLCSGLAGLIGFARWSMGRSSVRVRAMVPQSWGKARNE